MLVCWAKKYEVRVITKLVCTKIFSTVGLEEVCKSNEPLVKVIFLVDGNKSAMGNLYNLYEAINLINKALYSFLLWGQGWS